MRHYHSGKNFHSSPFPSHSIGESIHRFLEHTGGATAETLRRHAGVPQSKAAPFTLLLSKKVQRGELVYKNGLYSLPVPVLYEGILTGNEKGFAFLTPEKIVEATEKNEKELLGGDIFIPAKSLNGAMHKDRVIVRITKDKSDEGNFRATGEVVKILARGYTEIVGAFYKDKRSGRLLPDDKKYFSEIYISLSSCKEIKSGVKAVAKIVEYYAGRCPEGKIIEVLGADDDFFAEELSIIRSYNLREEFPDDVLKEAEKVAAKKIALTKDNSFLAEVNELNVLRRDLREEFFVTIDGADTRDIDDGVAVKKVGENYLLSVHIADVSHYVVEGGHLDKEALKRGTSVYFPDRVLPMLPKALSNGCCSLNEGEDRFAMTCEMLINSDGQVQSYEIFPSLVCSTYKMTYDEVDAIISGDKNTCEKYPLFTECAEDFVSLTNILALRRKKSGEVRLGINERKIIYDEKNDVIDIPDIQPSFSRGLIEQFMVTANETVATYLQKEGLPCLYRVHESPVAEKAAALKKFARLLGFAPKWEDENATPLSFATLLSEAEGSGKEMVLSKTMLRSMQKARYSEKNIGHFALASSCYCHFTSPIRRYPDLFVHRALKIALALSYLREQEKKIGKKDEKTDEKDDLTGVVAQLTPILVQAKAKLKEIAESDANKASLCERNADDAERAVDDLYSAVYMADYLGKEFDGIISGVIEQGLFVELKSAIEGFVPIETIDGYYLFDEDTFSFRGGGRKKYALGDSVKIRVADVDFYTRRITFTLVNSHAYIDEN